MAAGGVRESQTKTWRDELRDPWKSAADVLQPGLWQSAPLAPAIAAIASGSFKRRNPPDIRGTGYVMESIEAALWAFDRSQSFDDGALLAVNLGDDADTTGAIFGQLAGAFYGELGIPEAWRTRIVMYSRIIELADQLLSLAPTAANEGEP